MILVFLKWGLFCTANKLILKFMVLFFALLTSLFFNVNNNKNIVYFLCFFYRNFLKNAVIFGSNAGKQGGGGSGPIQKFSKVLDDER